jgi:hypothetical protein
MKQLYFLDEEEKNRILNLHESATKRHYLSEQAASPEWLPDPTKNPNWEYQFKDNKWFARKKNNPTIKSLLLSNISSSPIMRPFFCHASNNQRKMPPKNVGTNILKAISVDT